MYLLQTYVDGGLSTDDLGRERIELGDILQEGREKEVFLSILRTLWAMIITLEH